MESGETSLGALYNTGFRFGEGELFILLNNIIDQLAILAKNGICNRDIKPDNIIILKTKNNEYLYKVSDFGIGCYIENQEKQLISTSKLVSMTRMLAAPEVEANYYRKYDRNYYDPYKANVYSLGKTLQIMMDPLQNYDNINHLITMMLEKKPEKRISFVEIQEKLQTKEFQKFFKQPKMEEILKKWRNLKDAPKSDREKIEDYLQNADLYEEISHYDEFAESINKLEEMVA